MNLTTRPHARVPIGSVIVDGLPVDVETNREFVRFFDDASARLGALSKLAIDGVNVLHYINPSKWPGIIAGTSTDDLAVELQSALTAEPSLIFPDGLYNTSVKLIPRTDAKIRGINRRGAKLKATAAISILEFPINTFDPVVDNIRFQAGVAGASGITVAATAGTLQGYLLRAHIHYCDFDYDLAFGINADLIYATVEKSTFGYYGIAAAPAAGASTFCAIRSYQYPATTNGTNVNVVRDCKINNAGNANAAVAVALDLSGGDIWRFENVDCSAGGVVARLTDIQMAHFVGGWFEVNETTTGGTPSNALFVVNASALPAKFEGSEFADNNADRIFTIASTITAGLDIERCRFALNGGYVLLDGDTTLRTLVANGSVRWVKNEVTGANAANKLVTALQFRGGTDAARITAKLNVTGAAIKSSNDPSLTIVRNSAGDATITTSHPMFSGTGDTFRGVVSGETTYGRIFPLSTTQFKVQMFAVGGAVATDDVAVSVVIYGT